jgi:hypothetical protein
MAAIVEFSRNIRKRASNIENGAVTLVKRVAKTALRELVNGTPVKTGRARSNWRVSVGGTATAVIEPRASVGKGGFAERTVASATIAEGIAKINTLSVGRSRFGTGQAGASLRISNNVPYIDKLRGGSSTQQPNDWVAEAFMKAEAELAGARLLEPMRDNDGS